MKSIFYKINYFVLLISFAIGIFVVYVSKPATKIVIKYPTPSNTMNIQYQDDAKNCYSYKPKKVKCTGNEKTYPVQN